MMRLLLRLSVVLIVLFACTVTSVQALQNPIIPGFNPDPSIQRVGNDYFLVTSTFEWFPGVPVYHSRDLVKWNIIGHALNRPSQLNMRGTAPSGGVFAPTLRYHEPSKTFYMITTFFDVISPPDNVTRTPRSFYVKTKDIFDQDAWSDPTYVDQWGFDPDLFFDYTTGKTHLTTTMGSGFRDPDSGYFAVWKTEVDLQTGDNLVESDLFHVSSLPQGTPRLAEGSHFYDLRKTHGYIYLLTAEAGTENGHRAMIKRAKNMDVPSAEWEQNPNNPILHNGRNMSNPVLATGHADLVQTPKGDWYAVFLATRPQNPNNSAGKPQLGRETFLAPVKWDKDGWPVVNEGKDITLDIPNVLYDLDRPKKWKDDFKDGKLKDLAYYTPRTPYKKHWDLESRKGWLRLKGNVYTLDDRETPAALMRKQVDINTIFSTELEFYPTSPHHEAGATIYLSIHYHNEIAITTHPTTNHPVIVTKTRSGPTATLNTTYVAELPPSYKGTVKLLIKAESDQYTLGYALKNQKEVAWVASVESKWLQAYLQGWQVFTGSFFGVYATGRMLPILVPADFSYIQTELI